MVARSATDTKAAILGGTRAMLQYSVVVHWSTQSSAHRSIREGHLDHLAKVRGPVQVQAGLDSQHQRPVARVNTHEMGVSLMRPQAPR